jgi:diaminohydroxyphosphoribosylaminopyrimidine deaminase/5-amino-6-(5-phosphoribosylamino)uracil reductase
MTEMNDSDYMRMALELAARGAGRVSPNPMVGAVVVNNGHVVGQGYHQAVGGPHAEVHALEDAGAKASGATLYVTLEPCHHQGRTPPCTAKVCQSGIKRVVVAMEDPNPDVKGGGNAYLKSQGIQVDCGVCRDEARTLNESFVKYIRTKRPFVVLKLAATLDGRIATRTNDARWVTGAQARAKVHQLRHQLDAIMVGSGTVQADDPQLTTRLEKGQGADPIRIVLDTKLSTPLDKKLLDLESDAPTYLICGSDVDDKTVSRIEDRGAKVLKAALKNGKIDLRALLVTLGEEGITSLLIEGGSQVAGSAVSEDIVDKFVFFYAPKVLGGDDGVPMLTGLGPDRMRDALGLHRINVNQVGDDIMVTGYRRPLNEIDLID